MYKILTILEAFDVVFWDKRKSHSDNEQPVITKRLMELFMITSWMRLKLFKKSLVLEEHLLIQQESIFTQ